MRGLIAVAALLLGTANASAQAADPTPPGGISDDPAPPGRPPTPHATSSPTADDSEVGKHQLGVRARYIFVTKAMLGLYFANNTGTQLNSWSVGMEYIYRRPGKS